MGDGDAVGSGAGAGSLEPLVTVIIRSIGRPELGRALASVAGQSHRAIEVVCVNAKGAGHPPVEEHAGSLPVVVVGGGGALGRSAAANAGLRAATGRYVVFLDDDDWFLEGHVETLLQALAGKPSIRVAYASAEGVASDGTVVHRFDEPYCYSRLCIGNFIPVNAVLFERSLVADGCSFDESLDVYEDWDFWLQVAARSDFVHVNRVTARCSMAGSSGVGLTPDAARQQAARVRIYDKWRRIWSGAQIDAVIEKLQGEVRARERLLLEALAATDAAAEARRAAEDEAARARAQLQALRASRSWRWTAPFRRLTSFLLR